MRLPPRDSSRTIVIAKYDILFGILNSFVFTVFMIFIMALLGYLDEGTIAIAQINNPYQRFKASGKIGYFSILQHWHLMFLLSNKGLVPGNIVSFLNEMVKHKLLETDGATWRFRHRILQDYFYIKGSFETMVLEESRGGSRITC